MDIEFLPNSPKIWTSTKLMNNYFITLQFEVQMTCTNLIIEINIICQKIIRQQEKNLMLESLCIHCEMALNFSCSSFIRLYSHIDILTAVHGLKEDICWKMHLKAKEDSKLEKAALQAQQERILKGTVGKLCCKETLISKSLLQSTK